MSSYYDDVYRITKLIPKGRVSTYGIIADYLALGSARMVGYALSRLEIFNDVPAHRVVNRKGELTGRANFVTPYEMQHRLEKEGVRVESDRVVDFQNLIWKPSS